MSTLVEFCFLVLAVPTFLNKGFNERLMYCRLQWTCVDPRIGAKCMISIIPTITIIKVSLPIVLAMENKWR